MFSDKDIILNGYNKLWDHLKMEENFLAVTRPVSALSTAAFKIIVLEAVKVIPVWFLFDVVIEILTERKNIQKNVLIDSHN